MAKSNTPFTRHLEITYRVMREQGVLLVTQSHEGKPNVMTIGWGMIGIIWGKPIFLVLVRPSRYTYGLLEKSLEFTVNVQPPEMRRVADFCGTHSGRDTDKFKALDLTPAKSAFVHPPIIDQCAIHYECQVVHRNDVSPDELARQILTGCYAQDDIHRIYYGEILRTCIDPGKIQTLEK